MSRIPPIVSKLFAVGAVLALVLAMPQPTSAQEPPADGGSGAVELTPTAPAPLQAPGTNPAAASGLWFVELASAPAIEGTSRSVLAAEHAEFQAEAAQEGVAYEERQRFDTLFNGLSVQLDPAQVEDLAGLPSVAALYPVETIPVPETTEITPDLANALGMTGADIAQDELGLSGEGIKVAVMDTGIAHDHPDLGGCFGPFSPGQDCRIVAGFDFVGDNFNASGSPEQQIPEPDDDPMDCHGHGTHVSGIVGADAADENGVTGVAPGVTFGAYKVFGCDGSTTSDIMIAAMELALADGMDVLNMSIGAAYQWPGYPSAVASDRLVDEGMVVVASIGNSGASGTWSAGAPGVGEKVIGVASFDNTHATFQAFTVDGTQFSYGPASGAPTPPTSGTLPLAATGTPQTEDDACAPLDVDLTGQAALIRRGACAFHLKALHAQQAGAAAVVLYNNLAGRFSPTVAGQPPIEIPVVAILPEDGEAIHDLITAGDAELTWTDEVLVLENPTAGLISNFSSFGLAPDLSLKPDIGAPGGLINSTLPLPQGGYGTSSGTSMSSPHVAGAVALLLEAHPDTPVEDVRGILQNSAEPAPWWGDPTLGFLDNVHRQGAGMLDIPAAVTATTQITPGKLALGETEGSRPEVRHIRVHNNSTETVTYTLGHEPALSTGGDTFAPSYFTGFAEVEFLRSPVRLRPGQAITVPVMITPDPELPDLSIYGGYLVVTGDNGEAVNRVPYAGFKGDYQAFTILENQVGFPFLARMVDEADADLCQPGVDDPCFVVLPDGDTFTLAGDDVPQLLVHLGHQVQRLSVEVLDAADGSSVGTALEFELFGRSAAPTAFFDFAWDGTVSDGDEPVAVPDGEYVLDLTVLKALGDPDNPDHTESWTSPVVTIERPAAPACDETVTGKRLGSLSVTSGVTCLAEGTTVLGTVTVAPGAGLVATGADLLGLVSTRGAAVVELRDSRIAGAVTIRDTTGSVVLAGNQVLGVLNIRGNTSGDPIVVSGNQVLGLLTCSGNDPAPVNDGVKNKVIFLKLGQCAKL